MARMTLEQIAAIPRNFLTASEAAAYLECNPHSIRVQARTNPERLSFPVFTVGTRVKIPKDQFVATFRVRG